MAFDSARYASAFFRRGLSPFLRQLVGEATLADWLARWARERPEALAIQCGEQELSYGELAEIAQTAAQRLYELGARAGDTAALVGRNSIGYVAALLGGAASGVTVALVHPELAGQPLQDALMAARAGLVLCENELVDAVRAATPLPLLGFDPYERAPFGAASAPLSLLPARRSHDFALVFTSGTTGHPKACRLPHSRVLAAACLFGAPLFDFRRTDKLLCVLPLHHGSPLMLGLGTCLATATPLVLERRFSASTLVRTAQRTGSTALLYVGDLGRLMLAASPTEHDREHGLRIAVGNGMAADVWEKFQNRFGIERIHEFYAATESPVGILNLSGRVGSVGNLPYRWMFGLELGRVDEEGELMRDASGRLVPCGVDEPGELLVRARRRGLGVYHGYVDESATEARVVRNGFREGDCLFRTHDLLRRDRDGFYYFVERGGDSYRFRGENVAVATVEQELRATPGVRDALVTGLSLEGQDGAVGLAVLVTQPDFDVQGLAALKQKLPRSALPRFVRQVGDLARTSSLKLRRRAWAQQGVNPAQVQDPLWVLAEGRYRSLTEEAYRDVLAGILRL